jgi:hypothetical protein
MYNMYTLTAFTWGDLGDCAQGLPSWLRMAGEALASMSPGSTSDRVDPAAALSGMKQERSPRLLHGGEDEMTTSARLDQQQISLVFA